MPPTCWGSSGARMSNLIASSPSTSDSRTPEDPHRSLDDCGARAGHFGITEFHRRQPALRPSPHHLTSRTGSCRAPPELRGDDVRLPRRADGIRILPGMLGPHCSKPALRSRLQGLRYDVGTGRRHAAAELIGVPPASPAGRRQPRRAPALHCPARQPAAPRRAVLARLERHHGVAGCRRSPRAERHR